MELLHCKAINDHKTGIEGHVQIKLKIYTWQPQQTAFPHVGSRCAVRRLQSGNILLVKHGTEINTATAIRCDLTAFLSTDEGKTWSGGLLLDERTAVS